MTQNNAYINDVEDISSEITVDSEDDSSVIVQSQCKNNSDVSRISANNINTPAIVVPDKTPISHISSVALQDSTDVTFGNRTLYNGPVTVNQYGIESPSKSKTKTSALKIPAVSIIAIIVVLLISSAAILSFNFKNGKDDNYEIDDSPLKLVTREKWLAKPPTWYINDLITPVPLVIIHHTVTPTCNLTGACLHIIRQIQNYHINVKSIGDISYNFLVGGDGSAYEGRGWNLVGNYTKGYNNRSIGVGFIGNFTDVEPPKKQVIALLKLLRDGVQERKISENYTLIGANQVQNTLSPGNMLSGILQKLPHFADRIDYSVD